MFLETSRLLLRNWDEDDIDSLVEGLNNIEVSKWLVTIPYPYTQKDALKFFEFCFHRTNEHEDRTSYEFAIELKSEKKVIGGTNINKINTHHGTAGGGIWINESYHGKGYGFEAFRKRIDFAFNVLNLRRLENGYLEGNDQSKKMQERLGYVVEGKRRKGFMCMADGQLKDEYITALLKEEYHE